MTIVSASMITPLVEFEQGCFNEETPMDKALADIRRSAEREDGFFMVQLSDKDEFAAAYTLNCAAPYRGLLGRIYQEIVPISTGTSKVYRTRQTIALYTGASSIEQYCQNIRNLLDTMEELSIMGLESVFDINSGWYMCDEDPFEKHGLVNGPYDLLVAMAFAGSGNYQ